MQPGCVMIPVSANLFVSQSIMLLLHLVGTGKLRHSCFLMTQFCSIIHHNSTFYFRYFILYNYLNKTMWLINSELSNQKWLPQQQGWLYKSPPGYNVFWFAQGDRLCTLNLVQQVRNNSQKGYMPPYC